MLKNPWDLGRVFCKYRLQLIHFTTHQRKSSARDRAFDRFPHATNGTLKSKKPIFYYDIGDYLDCQTKLSIISNFKSIEGIENAGKFTRISPNKDYDWINQRDYGYLEFISIGDKKGKFKPLSPKDEINIFEAFSMGISTSRDAWVFNFSRQKLESNMRFMIDNYNNEVAKKELDSTYKPTMDKSKINWSRALNNDFNKGLKFDFKDNGLIISSHYRPFTKCPKFILLHKLRI